MGTYCATLCLLYPGDECDFRLIGETWIWDARGTTGRSGVGRSAQGHLKGPQRYDDIYLDIPDILEVGFGILKKRFTGVQGSWHLRREIPPSFDMSHC